MGVGLLISCHIWNALDISPIIIIEKEITVKEYGYQLDIPYVMDTNNNKYGYLVENRSIMDLKPGSKYIVTITIDSYGNKGIKSMDQLSDGKNH